MAALHELDLSARRFRLTVEDGKARVERTDARGGLAMSIGSLSALFTGYVSPADLVRVGALPSHPANAVLAESA